MKAFVLNGILFHPRERNSESFARNFRALGIADRDILTVGSFTLFETIVVIAACLTSFIFNIESHFSYMKPLWWSG